MTRPSFQTYRRAAMALDPIHVGDGGNRLGRVDSTIVRDPVTELPKIPGSSYAGVARAYAAMGYEAGREQGQRPESYYPGCAGQGQPATGQGHCGKSDCPICTVFGFARNNGGGFAGLAAFSDLHLLLHPVASREGPVWVTSPSALIGVVEPECGVRDTQTAYTDLTSHPINLGWLMLPTKPLSGGKNLERLKDVLNEEGLGIPDYILQRLVVVSDKLFHHVVNSTLEVRTSVAIEPSTGAADDGALFTYEALPRGSVLTWTVTCRNPAHFKVGKESVQAVTNPNGVLDVVKEGDEYLENLGIGGMNTRGMGRLRVIGPAAEPSRKKEGAA